MPTVDFTLNFGDCVTLFYDLRNPNAENTILFLHGLGTTHESWMHQIDYFAELNYRVIALDLPGFGQSHIHKGAFTAQTTAACVAMLHDTLHIEKSIIVGHSMGGPLAIYCCLHYPQYFTKAILINTFARIRPTNLSSAFAFVKRFVLANMQDAVHQADFIANKTFPGEEEKELRDSFKEQILQTDKTVYREAVNLMASINLLKQLKRLTIPTLVLTGTEDQTISPILQDELYTKIPNARQQKIVGGKHGMIFSQADLINSSIFAFINGSK